MENLINKTINKEDITRYVDAGDLPVKGTMGDKPSFTFMSESHTYIYKSVEERDADLDTIFKMF